jgi:prepilin-type N-terminal cleavage/methylation domain-containing protein
MMKTKPLFPQRESPAFTLIELIVVMAVIGILAALIFPVIGGLKKKALVTRVQTQMKSIESAIETYKENVKIYPPENPGKPELSPLFYELAGTTLNGARFDSGLGIGIVTNTALFFGAGVRGFVNVTRGSEDELQAARNCLNNLRPNQYLEVKVGGADGAVLGVADAGPLMFSNSSGKTINPWRYLSASATNNPGSFDLWVDVLIGGKTNRIGNWSDKPILVSY